jgi:hypothetical protein
VSQPVDDSKPVQLTADEVEFESGRNVYVARGHVVIDDEDQRLTADWVSFNPDTRKGIASGNVVISEGDDVLYADFVHFDVDTLEGVVFDGFLESGDSRFELSGEEIRRTGELTYEFKRGVFSTCRCPEEGRRPWQIRAGEADLEIEGYGTTRNTTFDVLGVPVLWFPWMIYPLKTERETGLLFPELNGSSRSGGDIGVPFFWAARHNVNVTVTPRWLWKRGFKGDLNVEYLLGEPPYSDTRWAFEWIHDQFLPADWRFKFDGRAFSDNRFSFDFQDFSQFRDDRYLESLTFLQAPNWSPGPLEGLGFLSLVRWADDQQNPDNQDRDQFLLQRLPEVQSALPPQAFRVAGVPIVPSFDGNYTNYFARRDVVDSYPLLKDRSPGGIVGDGIFADTGIDAVPDGEERNNKGEKVPGDANKDDFVQFSGPEKDGVFEDGEPLVDRGSRWYVNPRLAAPFRVGSLFEVNPEVGYLGTFYATQEQSPSTRHLLTTQLEARTRLSGSFSAPFGGPELVHVVEPRLTHTYVNSVSQSKNPLFVPETTPPQRRVRQLDLFNLTRDSADRIESVNALTATLGNRLYSGEGVSRALFADFSVSAQYDSPRPELEDPLLAGRGPRRSGPLRGHLRRGLDPSVWSRSRHPLPLPPRPPALLRKLRVREGALRPVRGGLLGDQPVLAAGPGSDHEELGPVLQRAVFDRSEHRPEEHGRHRVPLVLRVLGPALRDRE